MPSMKLPIIAAGDNARRHTGSMFNFTTAFGNTSLLWPFVSFCHISALISGDIAGVTAGNVLAITADNEDEKAK